jgi:hypothetical protein
MLRSPGLKTAGAFYAFATAADLVVKLPSPRVAGLIDSGRGSHCSPRPGRPMKEWVRIPSPDEESCLAYLLEARTFVLGEATDRRRPARRRPIDATEPAGPANRPGRALPGQAERMAGRIGEDPESLVTPRKP